MTAVRLQMMNGSAATAEAIAAQPQRRIYAHGSGPGAPVPDIELPDGDTASPLATIAALRTMEAGFESALSSGDPATMMAALAMHVRQQSHGAMAAEASATGAARGAQVAAQMAAYQKAEKSQADAATWGLVARIGAYIAAAVSVAVGVIGSVFSGGTSLAAGIGLAVLCISATASVALMAAQDLHAWGNNPPPRWLSIGVAILALVGTVCSGGAGAGGLVGAVGSAVSITAQTVSIATDIGVEAHAFPEPPSWFRMTLAGCSVAGAVTSAAGSIAGAGDTASAATTAANAAARGARDATEAAVGAMAQTASALTLAARAAGQLGSAYNTYMADESTQQAESHKRAVSRLHDESGDILEALRHVTAVYRRAIEHASDASRDENNHRNAIIGNFARA